MRTRMATARRAGAVSLFFLFGAFPGPGKPDGGRGDVRRDAPSPSPSPSPDMSAAS